MNEDANAKLIRELKEEIMRLKELLRQDGIDNCETKGGSTGGERRPNSTSSLAEEAVDQLQANEKLIAGGSLTFLIE